MEILFRSTMPGTVSSIETDSMPGTVLNGYQWKSSCCFNGNTVVASMKILLLLQWKSSCCFNGNTVPLSIVVQQCPAPSRQLRQISSWISSPRNISIPIQCVSTNNIIIFLVFFSFLKDITGSYKTYNMFIVSIVCSSFFLKNTWRYLTWNVFIAFSSKIAQGIFFSKNILKFMTRHKKN